LANYTVHCGDIAVRILEGLKGALHKPNFLLENPSFHFLKILTIPL